MHLVLAPVTEADLDEVCAAQYASFVNEPIHDALFGEDSPANRAGMKQRFLHDMRNDAADTWLKVTDADTGKIVCAANWKIYASYVEKPKQHVPADWHQGSEREQAEKIIDDFFERRRRNCKEAHVLLYILFTIPEYQYKGSGTMMVKWGCDLADHMFLPMWVESSTQGYKLYESNGFRTVEQAHFKTEKWDVNYTHMRRPAKSPSMVQKFA
ncbi:MAG: hypothetical protein M1825_003292 [Sarcosagium campestre]|nr:MAG: hypothetical protein M1825_003292 [Sarcosagium campestre]